MFYKSRYDRKDFLEKNKFEAADLTCFLTSISKEGKILYIDRFQARLLKAQIFSSINDIKSYFSSGFIIINALIFLIGSSLRIEIWGNKIVKQ